MDAPGYPKTTLNAVNRYRNRGKYAFEDVYPIFDAAPVLHVSFNDPSADHAQSYPYILPMFGCTGSYRQDSADRAIYLHGYISSKFFREANESTEQDGLKICVSATLLDGLVLALTPNHHSCNYRSAIAYGEAHLVTDEGERFYAMELITNNILPGRWENTRIPPTKAELAATGIVRVDVKTASAKVRAGTTGEDRNDLKDESLRKRVWTGVIPAWTQWGAPVAAPTDRMDGVPDYIGGWIRDENEKSEAYALGAAKPV
ncbi:hypothetical protein BDV26DRAFT_296626 [Aspergillus bertholletiae]|uniref:Flavin-nucleotide-binding protein n=1 Tax=Aspergillus bertholletiae TaxID=1226010 RepID=A0A5N7AV75_9EURO|nr:hypothetical protein BDV26DRAFT_296626 [Aspergillus bertholletiae]